MDSPSPFHLDLQVRDYECDIQGIVNNAVYQHYLEHARHQFLLSRGVDFAALAAQGVFLVVTRAELDYKQSLKSGDHFRVTVRMYRASRVRWAFEQSILRLPDEMLMTKGLITGTSLNPSGRPVALPLLDTLFQ